MVKYERKRLLRGRPEPSFYTVTGVARLYRVRPITVHLWIRRGWLAPKVKCGGAQNSPWMITPADLDGFERVNRGRLGVKAGRKPAGYVSGG